MLPEDYRAHHETLPRCKTFCVPLVLQSSPPDHRLLTPPSLPPEREVGSPWGVLKDVHPGWAAPDSNS